MTKKVAYKSKYGSFI